MKLYKLKSLEGKGLFHVLDMIVHERVYLSSCENMNDVNEGSWNFDGPRDSDYIDRAEQLREIVDSMRFTCFLEKINNPLMWAHYAGGFSGIALEYEIDPSMCDLRKIEYEGVPKITLDRMNSIIDGTLKPQEIGILKQKSPCWDYETEWRLYGYNSDKFMDGLKASAIIFGLRGVEHDAVLQDIAKKYGLSRAYMNPIDDHNYEVFYL